MFDLNRFTKEYFNHILNPKVECVNCNAWIDRNECHTLYDSEEVVCSQCYGGLEAKQLDKPEEVV